MSRARVSVCAEVDWTAQDESSAVLLVRAAHGPDQEIVEETDGALVRDDLRVAAANMGPPR